jgi:tRNA pseudouridine32 synthase/23S rRNA pseudouridine746 synthase
VNSTSLLTYFDPLTIQGITLPERFTFPFYYQPHPLARIAAQELQQYLSHQFLKDHNFGLDDTQEGMVIGKMFGVLVVKDQNQQLGYLSAFSGKLAGTNMHDKFVPPVFDMLTENSFFLQEVELVNRLNRQVELLENDKQYISLKETYDYYSTEAQKELELYKKQIKQNKSIRKQQREQQSKVLSPEAYQLFEATLAKQSVFERWKGKVLAQSWEQALAFLKEQLLPYLQQFEQLKKERREKSAAIQQQLFEQYSFLNQYGVSKSVGAIFSETVFGKPPAAAGECATPKLLQYAFANGFQPIAMAEFWWGASPKSEIRQHQQFYPSCTGKCEPILKHMLEGISMDENPLLKNSGADQIIDIVYEDDSFVVVNKPAEVLSVPGINIKDSVYTRLKEYFVTIEPLIIHRLDMATSGLLVVAKTKEAHYLIQKQFLKRSIRKRYTALLSKAIAPESGEISLPLRGDIDNRPRQLVCFEYGKKSITRFEVIRRQVHTTLVHFWPLTGRTHQLRVHAAHEQGIHAPIVGDDLYGTSSDRLYLHADTLTFKHPVTNEMVTYFSPAPFA